MKIASGGELSRIMLAIKTVLADKDDIDAVIFDEIDVGISGRTQTLHPGNSDPPGDRESHRKASLRLFCGSSTPGHKATPSTS